MLARDVVHRVDELTLHEVVGRLVVERDVMEGVRDDLGEPDEAGLDVPDEEQLDGAEDQTADADHDPHHGDVVEQLRVVAVGLEQAEQRGIEVEGEGRDGPQRHQHDLALKVVADLDVFLVLVGGLVDLVIIPRLEEEVADLTARHADEPGEQHGRNRVLENQDVGAHEAAGAQEVQSLVDTAVMIKAVVIPTLHPQGFEKSLHGRGLSILV